MDNIEYTYDSVDNKLWSQCNEPQWRIWLFGEYMSSRICSFQGKWISHGNIVCEMLMVDKAWSISYWRSFHRSSVYISSRSVGCSVGATLSGKSFGSSHICVVAQSRYQGKHDIFVYFSGRKKLVGKPSEQLWNVLEENKSFVLWMPFDSLNNRFLPLEGIETKVNGRIATSVYITKYIYRQYWYVMMTCLFITKTLLMHFRFGIILETRWLVSSLEHIKK